MKENSGKAVVGIIHGDCAGIGPEITAKMLAKRREDFIPLVIANRDIYDNAARRFTPELSGKYQVYQPGVVFEDETIYLCDMPAGPDIVEGKISRDSGKLLVETMQKAVELKKAGVIDGILMPPLTKQAIHLFDPTLESEFMFYDRAFGVKGCRNVVKKEQILRASVTGHIAFRDIADKLTVEGVVNTAEVLLEAMKRFGFKRPIAVSALNPHAGEDGIFGDEEARVLEPAIRQISQNHPDIQVSGPCPADTVFLKAIKGEVGGVVFLYHDQGNIAMKTWSFGEGVVIYVKIPCPVTSVGHGSALDIAGKGIADEKNLEIALDDLLVLITHERVNG
jgi:4-hydroxythreonine-4-phosphate dehydrogenase